MIKYDTINVSTKSNKVTSFCLRVQDTWYSCHDGGGHCANNKLASVIPNLDIKFSLMFIKTEPSDSKANWSYSGLCNCCRPQLYDSIVELCSSSTVLIFQQTSKPTTAAKHKPNFWLATCNYY